MNKKKFYMLIGVPASGKSTYIQNMFTNGVVISSDNFIEKMAEIEGKTYTQVFTKYVGAASKNIDVELNKAIADGSDIIWDQTNLTAANRAKKLNKIPNDYEKIAVYFNIPADLEKRLASRPDKTIPVDVMKSMIGSIEKPSKDEGFSEIIWVKNDT